MKIEILVSYFPPKWLAGTELATYNIAKHLVRRGHEVHVITSLDKGLHRESKEEGFFIHRIKTLRIPFLGFLLHSSNLLFITKKIDPDIICCQGITPNGLYAFILNLLLRMPYVVWAQASEIYFPWHFKKVISKLTLKNADSVIALTIHARKAIEKFCGDKKISIIPNGVDLGRFKNNKGNISEKLNIKKDEQVILFVGTLRAVKGVDYLISAMNYINERKTKIKLLIVGEGTERKRMEELVKNLDLEEFVNFVGKVPNEEIPMYMDASNVFVLPSLSEGFPLVLLEAMASGLPIVATDVRGLPEIVEDGKNGFLVEPKNAREIAKNVLHILKNDKLAEIISKNNKKKAKQYEWESIVQKLEEVYFKNISNKQ